MNAQIILDDICKSNAGMMQLAPWSSSLAVCWTRGTTSGCVCFDSIDLVTNDLTPSN